MVAMVMCVLSVLLPLKPVAAAQVEGWGGMAAAGRFVLLRHALAPGTGDPNHFDVDNCSTQRNLSDTGRKQAVRIGRLLREDGIDTARVYSSQWCRCLETARLLGFGGVQELTELNSFFREPSERQARTLALKKWMQEYRRQEITVLVTHQVNITALTGIYPSSGELVFVRLDGETVVVESRVETN